MPRKYVKRAYRRRVARKSKMPRRYTKGAGRLGSAVHRFTEKTQIAGLSCGINTTSTGTITYRLSDLTNAGSFANMFDLFKITSVKVLIVPRFSVSDVVNAGALGQAGALPMLYIAPNRNQFVPNPTSIADVLNDDGVRIIRLSKPVSFYLKSPKASLVTGGGEAAQVMPFQFGTKSMFQPWLTTGGNGQTINQLAAQHWGHRWVIQNPAGAEVNLDVYVTYNFLCKEQD